MRRRVLGGLLIVAASCGCGISSEGLGTASVLFDSGRAAGDASLGDDTSAIGEDAMVLDGGAGDDAAISDTIDLFPIDETGVDTAPPPECSGKPDGALCGDLAIRRICLDSSCVPTRCGDKFVDLGEDCDDGNTLDGDTCPLDCKYKCTVAKDPACDDKNACTTDGCDLAKHVCAPPVVVIKSTPCVTATGNPGFCNGTSCTSPACGNKAIEPGEECDDGNTVDSDGCKNDCTFTCKSNAECDDKNVCTGTETCDLGKHTCKAGTVKTCNDSVGCTADSCDPATGACTNTLIDFDGDGYANFTLGGCGKDCNDGNPEVHPGQTKWYDAPYPWFGGPLFDYDCSGKAEIRWPTIGKCEKMGGGCETTVGWAGGSAPVCGEARKIIWSCTDKCEPRVTDFTVKQQCH